jgi:hypothetical protein
MSAGWSVSFVFTLPLSDWEALVTAACSRGLSPGEVAAQAVQRELRLPGAAAWEAGVVAACQRAQPCELSVLLGAPLWPAQTSGDEA